MSNVTLHRINLLQSSTFLAHKSKLLMLTILLLLLDQKCTLIQYKCLNKYLFIIIDLNSLILLSHIMQIKL